MSAVANGVPVPEIAGSTPYCENTVGTVLVPVQPGFCAALMPGLHHRAGGGVDGAPPHGNTVEAGAPYGSAARLAAVVRYVLSTGGVADALTVPCVRIVYAITTCSRVMLFVAATSSSTGFSACRSGS